MVSVTMIAIDLAAISILTFGLYFPRHRRKDLVVAFLTVNVGVLAVSLVLASATVGLGVGLGLFGVLSIIRLRSSEIKQHEIAYYFASLALGLLAGLSTTVDPLIVGLMVLLLVVMLVGDHPKLFGTYRLQTMQLDKAYTDENALITALGEMLGARVHHVTVRHVDLINDSTLVEVRFQRDPALRTVENHERLDAR
jgi:MFS family permease